MKNKTTTSLKLASLILALFGCSEFISFMLNQQFFADGSKFNQFEASEVIQNPTKIDQLFSNKLWIHPYLGFVYDPEKTGTTIEESRYSQVIAEFGLSESLPPVKKPQPDEIVVGVFGASSAGQIVGLSKKELRKGLGEIPRFKGKKIVLTSLGIGGFKQPQQLSALIYSLILGAKYDLIINIDGFTEVGIPAAEVTPQGSHPSFPRGWRERVLSNFYLNEGDQDSTKRILKVRYWAARVSTLPALSSSHTVKFFWQLFDQWIINLVKSEKEAALSRSHSTALPYVARGPKYEDLGMENTVRETAEYWRLGSIMMDRIAKGLGIPYFHFLHPNQYDPGAKPYSEEEMQIAIKKESPYMKPVRIGYPILRELGKSLIKDGVHFRDLSQIFQNTNETRYSDNCCHFTKDGTDELVQAIVDEISKHL